MLRRAAAGLARWVLCAFSVVLLADQAYRRVPATDVDEVVAELHALAPAADTLILGSSQMAHGVIPAEVTPGTVKLCQSAQDPYYDARLARRFAGEMRSLRTVFWGVAPFTFCFDMARVPEFERRLTLYDKYVPRRDRACGLRCRSERLLEMLRVRGADPIAAFTTVLCKHLGLRAPGGDGAPAAVPREVDNGAARARYHDRLCIDDAVPVNIAEMRETTRLLMRRGVRVVFVQPPYMPSYRAAVGPRLRRRYEESLSRLLAETGAEYADLSGMLPPGRDYFMDSDHLRGEGARRFSRMLGRLAHGATAAEATD